MDTVLIFGSGVERYASLGPARRMGENELYLSLGEGVHRKDFTLVVEKEPSRVLRRLSSRPVDAVVIDGRSAQAGGSQGSAAEMLRSLFPRHDVSGPARRKRTLVLVSEDTKGVELAWEAGSCRVAGVLVAPDDVAVLHRVSEMTSHAARGKVALCLAGGGIEGLLYELGVLRALDHFMDGRKTRDLDLFYGISAGSILSALLANGLSADEIREGLEKGTPKLDRITRRELFDLNLLEFARRGAGLVRDVVGLGEKRNPLSALYRAIPAGIFAGEGLREYLHRQLHRPGMTDDFEELRRPLYIGATDMDTSEAVVFGERGRRDVPIHLAVRASCALSPFYMPQKVGGRWYVDGAFTRTTNMRAAVKHGATMVLMVDPLVPIYSDVAGYVIKRGGLFGTMQGLKSLINGRFDKAVSSIREMYPEVFFHLFRPEGDEMRVLSGSPMKFLYREEIEELAYHHTLRKIRGMMTELSRDFARHGWSFREPPRSLDGAGAAYEAALLHA